MSSIAPEPRLLDKLRHELQLKGYSPATEKNYSNALFHEGKTGPGGRWHINVSAVKNAISTSGKKLTQGNEFPLTLYDMALRHLLRSGCDLRQVQLLLGHTHVNTTMICAHILDAVDRS